MLVNLTWMKEFINIHAPVEEICSVLTQQGLEVEGISRPLAYLEHVYIGRVLSCERHPNAETLSICSVSLGESEYTIVCGAQNVRAGISVPVAVEGAVMPNGMEIKKAVLRGIESCGMICSEAELGFCSDSKGIWILSEDSPIGVSLAEFYNVADTVIEISITPNRGDCLSILGIARELAIHYSLPITMPTLSCKELVQGSAFNVSVDSSCASMYMMQSVDCDMLQETPIQMRCRLLSVGIRPISLIVDITNYVMIELGQPLHAYNENITEGKQIYIGYAPREQECTTLDGFSRTIFQEDIVVRSEDELFAIAGVMGGESSSIQSNTSSIIFESALFNSISIRKTSKRLALSTESSYRFERGVDKSMVSVALYRALSLLLQYSESKLGTLSYSVDYTNVTPSVLFRPEKARSLLGVNIDDIVMQEMLVSLSCHVECKDFFWKITPPTYRLDLHQEADIIEEIARLYGMDSIPTALPAIRHNTVLHATNTVYERTAKLKRRIVSLGLTEVISYSFLSQNVLEHVEGTTPYVLLQNPLSSELAVLRTKLLPSLLMIMQHNVNNGLQSLSIFEMGSVFIDTSQHSDTIVQEKETLGILCSGSMYPAGWGYSKESWDYHHVKGIVLQIIQAITPLGCTFKMEAEHKALSPCVRIVICGESIGVIGRVKPELAKSYDARSPVWYTELCLDSLYKYATDTPQHYQPLSQYPAITRDITFIAPQECGVGTILDAVKESNNPLIETIFCLDIYNNEAMQEKNVTVRVTLRDSTRTLTDKEADKSRDSIVRHVTRVCNVRV